MLTKMMRVDMMVSMDLLQDHSDHIHNLNGSNEQKILVQYADFNPSCVGCQEVYYVTREVGVWCLGAQTKYFSLHETRGDRANFHSDSPGVEVVMQDAPMIAHTEMIAPQIRASFLSMPPLKQTRTIEMRSGCRILVSSSKTINKLLKRSCQP